MRLPNITYPDASYECGITTIPQVDLLGRTDSDLNIYVTYDYAPNEYYLAYASFCILSITSFYRPIFGYINYNLGYQDETNVDDPLEFKE